MIGVADDAQSVSLAQFGRACARNAVPLSEDEIDRVYRFGCELNTDLGTLLAMAKHEGDFGRTPLQKITNNPLNIRAVSGDPRKMVYRDDLGNWWYRFESWLLGLLYGMLYLKNEYGGFRQLRTIREIIPVFAPASDGNIPERYIAAVLEDVAYMRAH